MSQDFGLREEGTTAEVSEKKFNASLRSIAFIGVHRSAGDWSKKRRRWWSKTLTLLDISANSFVCPIVSLRSRWDDSLILPVTCPSTRRYFRNCLSIKQFLQLERWANIWRIKWELGRSHTCIMHSGPLNEVMNTPRLRRFAEYHFSVRRPWRCLLAFFLFCKYS